MGKPKKGKKGRQEEDLDDDIDVDPLAQGAAVDSDDDVSKPVAKKGKKARKKKDDWEDDVADDIAQLSLKEGGASLENGVNGNKQQQKKKGKKSAKGESDEDSDDDDDDDSVQPGGNKSKMSAFLMLDMDSGGGSDSEEEVKAPPKAEAKPKKKEEEKPKPETKQDKKGKKGGKKGKNDDDDDFDAILAEFGAGEKKEERGKKGKKKGKEASPVEEVEVKKDNETSVSANTESDKSEVNEAKAEVKKDDPMLESIDISNMTQEQIARMLGDDDLDDDYDKKRKKKKKEKKDKKEEQDEDDAALSDDEEGGTMKTAAQKRKEKKERQKQKKAQDKTKEKKTDKEEKPTTDKEGIQDKPGAETADQAKQEAAASAATSADASVTLEAADKDDKVEEDEDDAKGKKKKKKDKKKKEEKEKEADKKKKPSKMVLAIQEQQKRIREEEERLQREEEEKERRIEEAIKAKEEAERAEKERKEKQKEKNRLKIERAKAEGRYLTPKQKEAQKKSQMMIEAMKAQGMAIPQKADGADSSEKKKRVVYDNRKKKKNLPKQNDEQVGSPMEEDKSITDTIEIVQKEESVEKEQVKQAKIKEDSDDDDVKDAWDMSDEEEEEVEEKPKAKTKQQVKHTERVESVEDDSEDESSEEESSSEEDSDSDDSEDETTDEDDGLTRAERIRERALQRIQRRKDKNEANRSTDVLRAPVVCVLGHVDTGKTKILDKLRRTNVQDGEAGGITQQIGATNVPDFTIIEQTKMCKEFAKKELKIPGLLIIDTPGHESFSNLRDRGSSLCDIAILVVDIMHGLEPQTIESINLLKQRKCPFIVALNKIDRLFQWQSNPHNDIVNTLKKQKANTKAEFDERASAAIVQFAEQGLNASLFYENKNMKEFISLVPTSAISGDGMGNLIALICELSQSFLATRVSFTHELQATVMEVKEIHGLGTTIDVILVNGKLREGDTIVIAGTEGPIVTQLRGLLLPKPLKELRVKGAYDHQKEVPAAQGVKVIAKDLEKALAGLPLHVAQYPDEVEVLKEEVETALADVLESIKLSVSGVFVQASTLGSLEALLQFLKDSKIPYAGINIGSVHRRDVMKASAMLERDAQWACILAFDVKIEREAQEMADETGVKIFSAEIIYHLFDSFMEHRETLKKQKQEEFKHIAVFPCKLKILPQYIFNSRDPIVMGVIVESGFIKVGTPLCVPSKEFLNVGRVTSLELNHKQVNKAQKGSEVCVKIESLPGDAPKMFGRHFDETDLLTSKISRESIDAVKNYFRDDMGKADWQVMVELKKLFEII